MDKSLKVVDSYSSVISVRRWSLALVAVCFLKNLEK